MIDESEMNTIKTIAEELLEKMTIEGFEVRISQSLLDVASPEAPENSLDSITIDIQLKEPQIIIGQNGQTLFEFQRLLKMILSKKLKKNFYLSLDINDYKKKKIEHLKYLARQSADEVAFTKKKKILSPMSASERRIVHMELAERSDITTESQGEGGERYIIIGPSA